MSSIDWTDGIGAASLSNVFIYPGSRFANWTPKNVPVGPRSNTLETGEPNVTAFRDDLTVSLQIVGIPNSDMAKMLRLEMHLKRSGVVTLNPSDPTIPTFGDCKLAPGADVSIQLSDKTKLRYTLSTVLRGRNVSGLPVGGSDGGEPEEGEDCLGGDCSGANVGGLSGVQDYGDALVTRGPGDYDAFRADQLTDNNYAPNPHLMDEFGLIDSGLEDDTPTPSHASFVKKTTGIGCHAMLKFERPSTDVALEGINWGGQVFLLGENSVPGPEDPPGTGARVYSDYFQRIVCQFSAGFEWRDDDDFFEWMRVMESEYVGVRHDTRNGGLVLAWDFTFSDNLGAPDLITDTAEFNDGGIKEILLRVRDNGSLTGGIIDVWYGTAFGELAHVLHLTPAYPPGHPTSRIKVYGVRGEQFYSWLEATGTLQSVPASGTKCYGLYEWELGDGANLESASWFDRLAA